MVGFTRKMVSRKKRAWTFFDFLPLCVEVTQKIRENDIHFRKSGIITNEIFDIEVVKIRFKIMSSITLLHILQRK